MKRAQQFRFDEFSVQNFESCDNTEGHFANARNAKSDDFLMIQEKFKTWNQITMGDCLTFPVNEQVFQVLDLY